MESPTVTVFMPLYNAEPYVGEAIQSILNQDYRDFELLIINDGSTDGSVAVVKSFRDPRIRLEHNEANRGLVHTANRGFELARGTFLARMDADDISLSGRLGLQVRFLESHPEIGICGGTIRYFGSQDGKMRCTCAPDAIQAQLFWGTAFAQPAVMMRRALMDQHALRYDPKYARGAEDYALWNAASRCFPMANLPQVLLRYRIHPKSVSKTYAEAPMNNTLDIIGGNFRRLGHPFDEETERQVRHHICAGLPVPDLHALASVEQLLVELGALNGSRGLYPEPEFHQVLREKFYRVCVKSARFGLPVLQAFRRSEVGGFAGMGVERRVRLVGKVLGKALRGSRGEAAAPR